MPKAYLGTTITSQSKPKAYSTARVDTDSQLTVTWFIHKGAIANTPARISKAVAEEAAAPSEMGLQSPPMHDSL